MDIPIQVAARICPCLADGGAPLPPATTKDNEQPTSDANGNNNTTLDGDVDETLTPLLDDTLDEQTDNGNLRNCVQAIPMAAALLSNVPTALPGQLDSGIAAGLVQAGPHSFPVTHALPPECSQTQIYHQTVFPLISLFMEGFDASVVTYGQRGTGKTYTLFGPGFDCVYGEADQGVVQRSVREIFAHIANHSERTYNVNIGWVEICGDAIRDLLGVGNVQCANITDVFHWLQLGLSAKAEQTLDEEEDSPAAAHSLFTLTLEQRWVSKEGLIQHRLSTASFSDLCGSERLLVPSASQSSTTSVPKDPGLQALEHIVHTLTDPTVMYGLNGNIPYGQTTLTTLLKDSFGGRAQTLVILCVSPLERDLGETLYNLQFAFKVQCVRNFVIMNTFSDDNTPISPDVAPEGVLGGLPPGVDNFGLQFAASQWFKLVSNAEGLFAKLVSSTALSELDKEQIEEWLFLKQECEECLSSSEAIRSQKQLGPIQEAEEPEETVSEPETSCQQNSDNESDSESQRPDLAEKLDGLMEELRLNTDTLVMDQYNEFIASQPNAVMDSQESLRRDKQVKPAAVERDADDTLDERKASIGGRRRSIQPGASLSSAEIAMLNRVATRGEQAACASVVPKLAADDFLDSSGDLQSAANLRAANNSPIEAVQKKLRQLNTDIEAHLRQLKELEQTMQLKQNIVTELVKTSDTRTTAKQRFHKKRAKLEAVYEKTKKQLSKAVVQGKERAEVERLRALIEHLEQRLADLTSIKHIAGESGQKVKRLQQSLHEAKKQADELQKKIKKEHRLKEQLEAELKSLKDKEHHNLKTLVKADGSAGAHEEERAEVQARITHLEHVLREKSSNLAEHSTAVEEREPLRHEIRNLRRTRDHLLDQRCALDRKLKRDKMLSHPEERKLLECDEAIEAIDAAIEFKNELICGTKSIDTSVRLQREKGEQMLMACLNILSPEEMRVILYKYYTKVIDLRDSSGKLEMQLMQLERERDAWEWKERVLSNAVRQARLEGERNAALLQRQHEMKLTLMLRHLAEETSASTSSASFSEAHVPRFLRPHAGAAVPLHVAGATSALAAHTTPSSSQYTDSTDFELEFYKNSAAAAVAGKLLKAPKHGEMEICPMPAASDALSKYKPLDKYKEKERESKNKLFAKFQVLTRYGVGGGGGGGGSSADSEHAALMPSGSKRRDKEKESAIAIPQENLKRLLSAPPATKVTRQKNKLIIQDASRRH